MELSHDELMVDPGDDSAVLRLYVYWVGSVVAVTSGANGAKALAHIDRQPDGTWRLAFSVDRGPKRRQRHFIDVDPDAVRANRWPMICLGACVWDLPKSIHVPGQFHGFVTVVGVPDPAPWGRGAVIDVSV